MRYSVLASGSQANATLVEAAGMRLLIDAGVRCRTLEARLKEAAIAPESIDAILITHEHIDHVAGLARFVKKYHTPVYANENTALVIERLCLQEQQPVPEFACFTSNFAFALGDLTVTPLQIPHDTSEPVGYLLEGDSTRLGYFTDLGYVPEAVANILPTCTGLIFESNHDLQMLRTSDRPFSLISRISGRAGHLSNEQACEAINEGLGADLQFLTLAHLSSQCNDPKLAFSMMQAVLRHHNRTDITLNVAQQASALPFMELH